LVGDKVNDPAAQGLEPFTGFRTKCPKMAALLAVRIPGLFNEIGRPLGPSEKVSLAGQPARVALLPCFLRILNLPLYERSPFSVCPYLGRVAKATGVSPFRLVCGRAVL